MEEQLDILAPTYRGNIWCTPQERKDWRLYLTELCDDPKNHIEAVDMIREAGEEDVIEVLITSPGGRVDIADMYLAAFGDSKAKIITRAIGECASAATTVFLAGDERVCDPGSYFMFHNVQLGGVAGDSANVFSRTKFYERLFKEKFYVQMSQVLNKGELDELFERAGEVYLTADEMNDRLMNTNNPVARDILTPPPGGICNHDTFGDSPRAVELREQVNAQTQEAMEKAGFITLPFPAVKVKGAAEFPQGDEFDITLEDGYKKTFRLSTLDPRDFAEYNTDEIVEMGQAFGADLSGLPYYQAVDALIEEIQNGGGSSNGGIEAKG